MTLRDIPSLDRLLQTAPDWAQQYPREMLVEALRDAVQGIRAAIQGGATVADVAGAVYQQADTRLQATFRRRLKRVINATGVVLHTNLGRAVLSEEAMAGLREVAAGYCNVEIDLESGERGHRHAHVQDLICRLTGAQAALVTNNNAAAMMLVLDELARGREVITSRGELVEIGGAFRIPDVLVRSGARLVEVGTTNKTYLKDYEKAITPDTGLLLKTHHSNFRMIGFTHEVTAVELAELGRRRGIPTLFDLGSGLLVPFGPEPTVPESVAAGIDIVCFSGDKLLGGPQAGIVVGHKELVERCRRNPLMRALRVDKLILAALEGTLRDYLRGRDVPAVHALKLPPEALQQRAEALRDAIMADLEAVARVSIEDVSSEVGGGTLPGHEVPSRGVRIEPLHAGETEWAARLRRYDPPVVVRIARDAMVLDVRTLLDDEISIVHRALRETRP